MLYHSDQNDWIMTAATAGGGDDSVSNQCGIAESHAYSLLAAFTMTDGAGTEHKMVLIRNPWEANGYDFTWGPDDSNWTDELVA